MLSLEILTIEAMVSPVNAISISYIKYNCTCIATCIVIASELAI